MTLSIIILLTLFVIALVLFVTEWISVDITALLLLSALLCFGLLSPKEGFAGFGSDTIIILASLFILTRVLLRTGVIEWISSMIEKWSRGKNPLFLLLGTVTGVSAFTSNTATTAVFLPVVAAAARKSGISSSHALMPLAFASILGGSMTLIGTSTNLVISGALPATGLAPLGFFELAIVGVPIAIIGLLYLFVIAPRLLPARETDLENTLRAYIADLTIGEQSPLVGKSLRETHLGRDYGLTVMAIRRGAQVIYAPSSQFQLQMDDVLVVEGPTEKILAGTHQLGIFSRSEQKLQEAGGLHNNVKIVEAVVMPSSLLIGKTLREAKIRERYGCSVLALHRHSRTIEQLNQIRIQVGDVLLLQGAEDRIQSLGDQVIILSDCTEARRDFSKAPLALIIFMSAILLGGFGLIPLSVSVIVAVALCLATRMISSSEAYQSIEWPVIILVGCMLAFGAAFENTGAANVLTQMLSGILEPLGATGLLAALFVITVILTQPMSNQAAALVMLPLAIGTAKALGYDPRPFVIGITIAASNSFLTPLEASCMLVYASGRYTFLDFVRVGAGLTLICFVLSMIIIPLVWPF